MADSIHTSEPIPNALLTLATPSETSLLAHLKRSQESAANGEATVNSFECDWTSFSILPCNLNPY